MKVTCRKPDIDLQNNIILRNIKEEDVMVTSESIMSIDGSTSNSGISIIRKSDGALFYSMAATREKDEEPVRYKLRLKKMITNMILLNPMINVIYYEEPFIGYASNISNLFMLKSTVEEIIIENEPTFDYIKYSQINNMKWKHLFLAPDKCPQGTELQKEAVRKKLIGFMPYLSEITQDEVDSYCMGFVACTKLANGTDNELESAKKVVAFQYETQFFGADCFDNFITEFNDAYCGPKKLLDCGASYYEINSTTKFDKFVYKNMGSDDKVLILRFPSKTHGDLILKYRLGNFSQEFDYIYAVVWRKTRKY